MRVYRIKHSSGAPDFIARSLGEVTTHLWSEFDDAETGDSATLTVDEMDAAEVDALPEWEP